ncbi:hypothetical protein ACLOJK_031850 [Asimina triloba]
MAEQLIPGLPDEIARECLARVPCNRFCNVRAVCRGWRAELDSPDFYIFRKSTGLSRSVVAFSQNERTSTAAKHPDTPPVFRLSLIDPISGAWERPPPVPGHPHGLPLFCRVAASGRSLVVIGGWDPATWSATDAVHVYDLASATWRAGAPMPGPLRSFFGYASDSRSTVYVAGGHDEHKNALRSALAYDVAKDKWAPLPDMARERDECKGVFWRGEFHVIGGYGTEGQGRFVRSGESFCNATWQWGPEEEDVLEVCTCPSTCGVGPDSNLYMSVGGHVVVREGAMWRRVAKLPREAEAVKCLVAYRRGLVVVACGGQRGPHSTHVLELVGPMRRCTWTRVDMPAGYAGHVSEGCCFEI